MTKMKKITALVLSAVLLVTGTVAATGAYLTDTKAVTNTFTMGEVEITLAETCENEFQLIPGKKYEKDPVVTVVAAETNVDVFLYVEFDPTEPDKYLDYTSALTAANGWTEVAENVWGRRVNVSDATKSWNLIEKDTVTVKSSLEEKNMPAEDIEMAYTAYAIQAEGFDLNSGWTALNA